MSSEMELRAEMRESRNLRNRLDISRAALHKAIIDLTRLRAVLAGLPEKIDRMPAIGFGEAYWVACHNAAELVRTALAELPALTFAPVPSDGLPETMSPTGQCDECAHNDIGNAAPPCVDCGLGADSKFAPVPSEARAEAMVEDGEQWDGGML